MRCAQENKVSPKLSGCPMAPLSISFLHICEGDPPKIMGIQKLNFLVIKSRGDSK